MVVFEIYFNDNFYNQKYLKKMKRSNKRFNRIGFLIVLSAIYIFTGCNPRDIIFGREEIERKEKIATERTEREIKESSELKDLNELCQSIPRQDGFELLYKDTWINDNFPDNSKRDIFLTHKLSSKVEFKELKKVILDYFLTRGWTRLEQKELGRELRFRKDNYAISISYQGQEEQINYFFTCVKTIPKN